MEQFYAHALWRLIEGGKTPHDAVKNLHQMLKRHGRTSLLPKIARAFARIASREEAKNAVTLTVAHEKDEHRAHAEAKIALEEMGISSKEVIMKRDENLIGGWRLEGRGRLVDASFRNQLLSLYNRATS